MPTPNAMHELTDPRRGLDERLRGNYGRFPVMTMKIALILTVMDWVEAGAKNSLQWLLEDARSGKFSHVIVERADRFGRNDTEALRAIDELDEFGCCCTLCQSA